METEIYLDTARLGRMRPSAQAACRDFARLCGDEGGSVNVEAFLREGHGAWPQSLQKRYPGLSSWTGANGFKQSFRDLVQLPPETNVWLAQRSKPLMRLAARALCRRCERIIHTDLEWPPYLDILRAEARRLGREVIEAPTRTAIFAGGVSTEELVQQLAKLYRQSRAQGLFISDVSFEGVRLPVRRLIEVLTHGDGPKFIAIDAAQGLGHVPSEYESSDLILVGCHKWLEAGFPLSAALAPRERSQSFLGALLAEMIAGNDLDDPFLSFREQLKSNGDEQGPVSVGETINLTSLFPAAAVIAERLEQRKLIDSDSLDLAANLTGSTHLATLAETTGWIPIQSHIDQRTAILLLKPRANTKSSVTAGALRDCFHRHGIALTVFPSAVLRASIRTPLWTDGLEKRLTDAMNEVFVRFT